MWFTRRNRRELDLDDEIAGHLRMATGDRVADGDEPGAARRAARREFGNVGLVKEVTRDVWGWNGLGSEFRSAWRNIKARRVRAVLAVVLLAAVIGSNTMLFSVADSLVFHRVTYRNPDTLVHIPVDFELPGPDEPRKERELDSAVHFLKNEYLLGDSAAEQIAAYLAEAKRSLGTVPTIGSGPYQLADHTFGVRYLWKRFDKYRKRQDGGPYIDEREVLMLTDQVAIEAAFRSGQIHVWNLPASAVERVTRELGGNADFQSDKTLTTSQYKIEFNCDPQYNKVYRDVRVPLEWMIA